MSSRCMWRSSNSFCFSFNRASPLRLQSAGVSRRSQMAHFLALVPLLHQALEVFWCCINLRQALLSTVAFSGQCEQDFRRSCSSPWSAVAKVYLLSISTVTGS